MVSSAPQSELAVDLRGVEKVYKGKVHALRGVDLRIHPGEIFGLLGPNGAGKSTLVKIMMTVVRPTKATGTVLGQPVGHKPTLAKIGYLPEHHRFPRYLTGRQTLEFFAALANVDRATRRKRADELLKTVGMTDWANKKVSAYSKGMMQRVGLAQALMNDPDLVVLDEPTDGVDPVGRREIRDVLVKLRETGHTILLNSHLLSELEMVCGRVAILVQGQVAMQGTLDELTHDSQRYEVEFLGDAPAKLAQREDVKVTDVPAGPNGSARTRLTIMGTDPNAVQPVLDALRNESRIITSVRPVRESLEDLFMRAIIDPETGIERLPGAAANITKRNAPPAAPPRIRGGGG